MGEDAAFGEASALSLPITSLRIGNVAGADALFGLPRSGRILLDQFADGQGPLRSYIGPHAFADIMARLVSEAGSDRPLPKLLNLALPGAIGMADLLLAAQIDFDWRPAPQAALPLVELDVTRLTQIIRLGAAQPTHIVADWRSYEGQAS